MERFKLRTTFVPTGDQPVAIQQLVKNITQGIPHQVLLGVTGSGKTFTMANVMASVNKPTLIIAPNKTLAAQLFIEFKELFPENAVEYFVSFYDYYQPEAYIPATDTYIEKDSAINDTIDKMRHSATRSLLERNDVVIVASVSCIYGLGDPNAYYGMVCPIELEAEVSRDEIIKKLVEIRYDRDDTDFHRGTFRVKGDVLEIFPAYEDQQAIRVEFFGDYIESIAIIDPIRGATLKKIEKTTIYPTTHYISWPGVMKNAVETVRKELKIQLKLLRAQRKILEAKRLEQRTNFDLEMLEEMNYCAGIENYSRHLTGRKAGEPPFTLLDYFPKDFLLIIDESHISIPQLQGMYRGDRSRKETLVEHGFRMPSALDNRPLTFEEFEKRQNQVVYVSATPAEYEKEKSKGTIVEQIIRPTGLIDPKLEVRPAAHQIDELLGEIKKRIDVGERVLVTTLTKKMAENLTEYYEGLGLRVKYLHSDIGTLERSDIIRDLRKGVFDVLVGINLLREGLDLPEVSLVAILDADKEGFLRSARSLIQTIGRASRNSNGTVIMFADVMTDGMKTAIGETNRRRKIQEEHNRKHGIIPQTIKREIQESLSTIIQMDYGPVPDLTPEPEEERAILKKDEREAKKAIAALEHEMKEAAKTLDFERAAALRDRIRKLKEVMLLKS